jgi:hypothetical protein
MDSRADTVRLLGYLMLTAKGTKLTKGEKKKRLPDEEKASRTVTINLDGLSHEAIIGRVAEVMRDVGSPEREIACFKDHKREELRDCDCHGYRMEGTRPFYQEWQAMVSCRLEKAHPMATGQAKGISLGRKLCASGRGH